MEAPRIDAVGDDRPLPGDPGPLSGRPLGLADTHQPVGPTCSEPLPPEGESGGGPADRLERPGVRLEHGRDPPPDGEPPGEPGLRTVRVHQVGPHGVEHPSEPPHLAGQRGPRRPRRLPPPYVRAQGPQVLGEGAVGTGDGDVQPGGELGARQVRHDAGDPAVHGLGEVQDPRSDVGFWLVHRAVSSLTGGARGRGGNASTASVCRRRRRARRPTPRPAGKRAGRPAGHRRAANPLADRTHRSRNRVCWRTPGHAPPEPPPAR